MPTSGRGGSGDKIFATKFAYPDLAILDAAVHPAGSQSGAQGHGERRVDKLRNAANSVSDAQRLRWRRAQGFMSAA